MVVDGMIGLLRQERQGRPPFLAKPAQALKSVGSLAHGLSAAGPL
jgi:hypothetical protein